MDTDDCQTTISAPSPSSKTNAQVEQDNEQKQSIKKEEPSKPLNDITIWKGKWKKKEYAVYFDHLTSIANLKEQLMDETNVKKEKIKLVGLKYKKEHKTYGKINDNSLVHHLECKSKKGFIMIGTLDKNAFKDSDITNCNVPFVIDDFDFDYSDKQSKQLLEIQKANHQKLEKVIADTTINNIVLPRKGKKLLVLDIDYTIFDMGSKTESWASLKRPYTEYLMENCWKYYDICIWSQTSWRWIEIKLTEMNMFMNDKYKITFVLDKKAMFTIKSQFKNGKKKHYVKPLQLIWRKYKGQYDENNTIHIDDLSRNFALNVQQGLTCTPYKNAYVNKYTDTELLSLTHYLVLIAKLDSFKDLNHNKWKEYLEKHGNEFANQSKK